MPPKLTDVSTVIIINKNQQTRSIQVKTKHLNRLNRYALITLLVVVCLSSAVFYLRQQNNSKDEENRRLASVISKLKISTPVKKADINNSNTARSYIQSIQQKLETINTYLKKRGLKGFKTDNTGSGGEALEPKLSATEQYAMYNDYLDRVLFVTAFTPMGYPHSISRLTSLFGYRSDPFDVANAEYHPGIDFQGAIGDQVKCTANGKVIFAGWYGGYGNCVRIQHANNFETLYGHLSKITVKTGQNVTVGDVIGAVGSTGHSTGAHLHYEVRKDGKPVNPINFLTLNS